MCINCHVTMKPFKQVILTASFAWLAVTATAAWQPAQGPLMTRWAKDVKPGKALPESAKKGLEDLGVHQDLGDAVLYSYRVK